MSICMSLSYIVKFQVLKIERKVRGKQNVKSKRHLIRPSTISDFIWWVPLVFSLQVDEDVQRHDELLEVIRTAPSEINEVVARRRKDFTKEFFVHVHTVAESYYDNPSEQNGET